MEAICSGEVFLGAGSVRCGYPRDPSSAVAALHILTVDMNGIFPPSSVREYNAFASKKYFLSLEDVGGSSSSRERLTLQERDELLDGPMECIRCGNAFQATDWEAMQTHLQVCDVVV